MLDRGRKRSPKPAASAFSAPKSAFARKSGMPVLTPLLFFHD
jgi:hypothetical protein